MSISTPESHADSSLTQDAQHSPPRQEAHASSLKHKKKPSKRQISSSQSSQETSTESLVSDVSSPDIARSAGDKGQYSDKQMKELSPKALRERSERREKRKTRKVSGEVLSRASELSADESASADGVIVDYFLKMSSPSPQVIPINRSSRDEQQLPMANADEERRASAEEEKRNRAEKRKSLKSRNHVLFQMSASSVDSESASESSSFSVPSFSSMSSIPYLSVSSKSSSDPPSPRSYSTLRASVPQIVVSDRIRDRDSWRHSNAGEMPIRRPKKDGSAHDVELKTIRVTPIKRGSKAKVSKQGLSKTTKYNASVKVTGWSYFLKPEGWSASRNSDQNPPSLNSISVKAVFGAAAAKWSSAGSLKVEQEIQLEDLVASKGDDNFEFNFDLNTDSLVTEAYLEKSPDLAYNIPSLVQIVARGTSPHSGASEENIILAECRRYLDISEETGSPYELTFAPQWRFISNMMSPIKFEVANVQSYH